MIWILYALLGIGLHGGYKHWPEWGKLIFFAFFPIHTLLFLFFGKGLHHPTLHGIDRFIDSSGNFMWGLIKVLAPIYVLLIILALLLS